MRQVIYRRAPPPVPPDTPAGDIIGLVRLLPLLAAPVALLATIGVYALVAGAILVIIFCFWLWARVTRAPMVAYPDFVARDGEELEVAGPGIVKAYQPALRLPLREIGNWRSYEERGGHGAAFDHGRTTYRLAVGDAEIFDLEVLAGVAPDLARGLGRR